MKPKDTGFELLDHPADMGFRTWAPSLNEMFVVAARALSTILVDLETIETSVRTEVEVEGEDEEMLLYNWLSEILFLFDADGLIFSEFSILDVMTTGNGFTLKAMLSGEQFSSSKHQVKTYVKAVTLHQLKVKRNETCAEAQIYLDI